MEIPTWETVATVLRKLQGELQLSDEQMFHAVLCWMEDALKSRVVETPRGFTVPSEDLRWEEFGNWDGRGVRVTHIPSRTFVATFGASPEAARAEAFDALMTLLKAASPNV